MCKSVIMVFCKNMKKGDVEIHHLFCWREMGDSYSVSPVEGESTSNELRVYTQVLLAILHQMW